MTTEDRKAQYGESYAAYRGVLDLEKQLAELRSVITSLSEGMEELENQIKSLKKRK